MPLIAITRGLYCTADDDFDDFQAAPVSQPAKPAPSLMDMLNATSRPQPAPAIQPAAQPIQTMFGAPISSRPMMSSAPAPGPSLFGGVPALNPTSVQRTATLPIMANATMAKPVMSVGAAPASAAPAAAKPSANFDDLWSLSLGSGTARPASASAGKSIKDLEKEKAMTGLWGSSKDRGNKGGAFGAFGVSGAGFGSSSVTQSSGGADDLLL